MADTEAFPRSFDVVSKSADFNVLPQDNGKTFIAAAVDLVATLPKVTAALKGMTVTFVVTAPSAGTGFSISPNAADEIKVSGLTAADNKDVINSGASDTEGDSMTLVCDGSAGWIATAVNGTWAMEA